jgi:predicted nucleotidyltransferase
MTPDPRELLVVLARHDVDFVVIGGVAVQAHGHLRTTRDVDIIAAPAPENARRLAAALRELDARNRGVDAEHLDDPTDPVTFARAASLFLDTRAGMLDVMQDAAGAPPYAELHRRAVEVTLGTLTIRVAGLDDLIALKRAAARPVDLEDIAVLADLQRLQRNASLDDARTVEPPDPAAALLGPRPKKGRAARAWDAGAELVYAYRDEFGRPARLEPDQPVGRRPPDGTRQRRVWERLVRHVAETRAKLGRDGERSPGDLGEDVGRLADGS